MAKPNEPIQSNRNTRHKPERETMAKPNGPVGQTKIQDIKMIIAQIISKKSFICWQINCKQV